MKISRFRFTAVLTAAALAIAVFICPFFSSPKKVNALSNTTVDFTFQSNKTSFIFVAVGDITEGKTSGPIMYLQYRDANGYKRYLRFYYSNINLEGGDISVDIQWQTNEPFFSDSDINTAEWYSARGGRVPFNSVFYFSVLNASDEEYGILANTIDFGYFTDFVQNKVWSYKLTQLSDLDYGFKVGNEVWEGVLSPPEHIFLFDYISYVRTNPQSFANLFNTNYIFKNTPYYRNIVRSAERNYIVGYDSGYDDGANYNSDTTSWITAFLSGFAAIFGIMIFPHISLGVLVGIPLLLGFVYLFISFKNGR